MGPENPFWGFFSEVFEPRPLTLLVPHSNLLSKERSHEETQPCQVSSSYQLWFSNYKFSKVFESMEQPWIGPFSGEGRKKIWALTHTKFFNFAGTCTRDRCYGEEHCVQIPLRNSTFPRNYTLPKFISFFSFGPTLGPIYPMKEAEIEKNKNIYRLNSGIGLSKNGKSKTVALLSFKWKIGLLFALFRAFLGKKRGVVKG